MSTDPWPPGDWPQDDWLSGPPPDEPAPGDDEDAVLGQMRAAALDSEGLDSIPDPEPIIDGLLYRNTLAWLTGQRGNGKSLVGIDMAGAIGNGHAEWFGHKITPGRVVYAVVEGSSGYRRRVRAWEATHGRMNVTFLPFRLRLPAHARQLAHFVAGVRAGLLIIDTQAAATPTSDEGPRDMGLLAEAAEDIREATGACVLFLHHEGIGKDRPRGHSKIDGIATTLLRVEKDGPVIKLTNPKQRDAAEAHPVSMLMTEKAGSVVLGPITPVGLGNSLTETESKVMTALLDLIGAKGYATWTDLQGASGLPKSSLAYALSSLLKKGKVTRVKHGRSNRYGLPDKKEKGLFDEP